MPGSRWCWSVPRGGTGTSTFTTNGVLFGNGAGAIGVTSAGGANTVLTANGGNPSFSSTPTVTSLTTTGDVTVGGNAGTSSYVSQTTGWRVDNGGRADFTYLFTQELRAKLFTAARAADGGEA